MATQAVTHGASEHLLNLSRGGELPDKRKRVARELTLMSRPTPVVGLSSLLAAPRLVANR